jgi:UDP-perosamine 4-acetyltransferase
MIHGIVVVGAGGHAKVCIELLQAMGENVSYCIGGADSPDLCIGVPVLKGDAHLEKLLEAGYSRLFVAIGSNSVRARLSSVAVKQGYQLVNAISPHAIISPSARLGAGIAVMAGAVINAAAEIGDLAIINTGATVDHDCRIGEAVHLAPQSGLAGNVIVGRLSFLGVGCKVIPGIEIGQQVTVGAGGVVISNINDGATVVGVPARSIKQ